jgi:hypothetical protein
MRKSAERLPLRLLTPGILLFLLAHAFGSIIGHAPANGLSPATKSAQYLDDGTGNARTTRPPRIQVRSPRGLETGRGPGEKSVVPAAAVAYVAVALGLGETPVSTAHAPPAVRATANDPIPRAQNPRDPPRLST